MAGKSWRKMNAEHRDNRQALATDSGITPEELEIAQAYEAAIKEHSLLMYYENTLYSSYADWLEKRAECGDNDAAAYLNRMHEESRLYLAELNGKADESTYYERFG